MYVSEFNFFATLQLVVGLLIISILLRLYVARLKKSIILIKEDASYQRDKNKTLKQEIIDLRNAIDIEVEHKEELEEHDSELESQIEKYQSKFKELSRFKDLFYKMRENKKKQDSNEEKIDLQINDEEDNDELLEIIERYKRHIDNLEAFKGKYLDLKQQDSITQTDISSLKDQLTNLSIPPDIDTSSTTATESDHYSNPQSDILLNASKEISKLRQTANDQELTIEDLQQQISDALSDDESAKALEAVDKLKQMLKESDSCITLLENSLDEAFEKVRGLEASLNKQAATQQPSNKEEITKLTKEIEELNNQNDSTTDMAMLAMKHSGELAVIISFLRRSISNDTINNIAEEVAIAADGYNLYSTVRVSIEKIPLYISFNTDINDRHWQFINKHASTDVDYFQEDELTLFSYKSISLVVEKLPLDDMDQVNRIKDNINVILQVAHTRIKSVQSRKSTENSSKLLKAMVGSASKSLVDIENQFQHQANETTHIMDKLNQQLTTDLQDLQLSEQQHQHFTDHMQESISSLGDLYKEGAAIDHSFKEIIGDLQAQIH